MTADGTRVHSMSLSRQSQKALLRCTWGHRDGWVSRHVFDFYVDRRSASATAQFSVTRPMPMPTQCQTWNDAGRVGARCRARRSGGAAAGAADGVSGSDPRRVSFLRGATSAGCGCSSVDTRQPLASPLLRSKPRDPPSSGVGGHCSRFNLSICCAPPTRPCRPPQAPRRHLVVCGAVHVPPHQWILRKRQQDVHEGGGGGAETGGGRGGSELGAPPAGALRFFTTFCTCATRTSRCP
jgi:hypothetical protein